MTVSAQTPYNLATGNGVTTVFPYQFKILAAADLQVYIAGSLKTLNVDYSVSGVGVDVGGSVTFLLGAPAALASVSIIRAMTAKRTTDYQQLGDFLTPVVNPDFDNAILLIQDLQTQLGRSIRTPADEVGTLPTLPSIANRAGKYGAFDALGLPIASSGTGNDSALRTDLAVSTSGSEGGKLIAFRQTGTGSVARTAQSKLAENFTHADFGVTANGVANDTTAANNAETAAAKAEVTAPLGPLLRDPSSVTVQQRIVGQGWTSDTSKMPSGYFKKNSNGVQILLSGDYSGLRDLTIDGNKAGGKTGDGVQVAATRAVLQNVSSLNQQADAFRLGGAGATGVFNANLALLLRTAAVSPTGKGYNHHHTGGTVTAQFPNGVPDANAGLGLLREARLAGGIGIHWQNAIDWADIKPVAQSCTGKGIVLDADAKGIHLFSPYAEANNGGGAGYGDEIDIVNGAYGCMVLGNRTTGVASGSGVRDQCAPGKNLVTTYENTLLGGSWTWRGKISLWNELADATGADLEFFKGAGQANIVSIKNTLSGASGGVYSLYTKIDGGASTLRCQVLANGDVIWRNQTTGTLFGGKTAFDTTTTGTTIEHGAGRVDIVNSGAGVKTAAAFYDASGACGSITTSGAGATAYNTSSDVRLKASIVDAPDQGSVIDAIRIVEHEFKAEPGKKHIGVIAHELQQVVPNAVTGEPDAIEVRHLEHHSCEEVDAVEHETWYTQILGPDGKPQAIQVPRHFKKAEHKVHCERVEQIVPQGVDFSKLVPLLIAEVQALRRRASASEERAAASEERANQADQRSAAIESQLAALAARMKTLEEAR